MTEELRKKEVEEQMENCRQIAESLFIEAVRPVLLEFSAKEFKQDLVSNYAALNVEMAWNHLAEITFQFAHHDVPISEMKRRMQQVRNEINFRLDEMLANRLESVVKLIAEQKAKTEIKQ